MKNKTNFPFITKSIKDFLVNEEGHVNGKDVFKTGNILLGIGFGLFSLMGPNSVSASHTSHGSHGSHGSHSAHSSHGSHGSHTAHASHSSHGAHGSHGSHSSHSSHSSHANITACY